MTVKQILADVFRVVGRAEAAENLLEDSTGAEEDAAANTLLLCLNAVCDELARAYFPLNAVQSFNSEGEIALSSFDKPPVRIKGVTAGGRAVGWSILRGVLVTEAGVVEVSYEYALPPFSLNDAFDFPDYGVSERLVCYGVAAEYYLFSGDAESSAAFEARYRSEIERILSLRSHICGRIPPRRWV